MLHLRLKRSGWNKNWELRILNRTLSSVLKNIGISNQNPEVITASHEHDLLRKKGFGKRAANGFVLHL
jgi:hypothetical protein